jgi:hypothetical protein
MANTERARQVYEDLAQCYERQNQAKQRDWFLVLAADAAQAGGRGDEAERLRGRLLHVNPHHMLRPFDSFADSLTSPSIQGYLDDLRRLYPVAAAEQLLEDMRQVAGRSEAGEQTRGAVRKPAVETLPLGLGAVPEEPEVQVFRLEAMPAEPRTAVPPRPASAPLPRKAAPASFPVAPAVERAAPRPVTTPAPRSRAAMPAPAAWTTPPAGSMRSRGPDDEEMDPTSAWVSMILFLLLLLAGLGLVGYVLVWPLLRGRIF